MGSPVLCDHALRQRAQDCLPLLAHGRITVLASDFPLCRPRFCHLADMARMACGTFPQRVVNLAAILLCFVMGFLVAELTAAPFGNFRYLPGICRGCGCWGRPGGLFALHDLVGRSLDLQTN